MPTILPYALCATVALMLAAGQLLFKLAAVEWKVRAAEGAFISGLLSWPFVASVGLYGVATLLWIYALQFVPLSRAYLFVLGGAILVPVMAHILFGEPLGPAYWLGFAMVVGGIWLCSI